MIFLNLSEKLNVEMRLTAHKGDIKKMISKTEFFLFNGYWRRNKRICA